MAADGQIIAWKGLEIILPFSADMKARKELSSHCELTVVYGSSDFKHRALLISRLTVRQCKGLAVKTDQRLIDMQKEKKKTGPEV